MSTKSSFRFARAFAFAVILAILALAPSSFAIAQDWPEKLRDLVNQATNLRGHGEFQKALEVFDQAYQMSSRLNGLSAMTQGIQGEIGSVYMLMGDYARAEEFVDRTIKYCEANLAPRGEMFLLSVELIYLARIYMETSREVQAEPLLLRSLKIRQAMLGANDVNLSTALGCLGDLYLRLHQYAKAESAFERCLTIREASLGRDHVGVAECLGSLANARRSLEKFDQAEADYQRAIKIIETNLGPDHFELATLYMNLSELLFLTGRVDDAFAMMDRSASIAEKSLGPRHPSVADILTAQALDSLKRPWLNLPLAERRLAQALEIRQAIFGPDSPKTAQTLVLQAIVAWKKNDIEQAAELFDRTRHITRRHEGTVLPGLSEQQQLRFLTGDEFDFGSVLTIGAMKPSAMSYAWLLNRKGISRQILAERALLARDSIDPALAGAVKDLAALRKQLAELSLAQPSPAEAAAHQKRITVLADQEEELTRQINARASRSSHASQWMETSAVQAALAKNAVLIDIVRYRPQDVTHFLEQQGYLPARYVAWIIPPAPVGEQAAQAIQVVDLGDAAAIDAEVAKARKAIEKTASGLKKPDDEHDAEQRALEPLRALSTLLLKPLEPHLAGINQLVLSPDSTLWLVPWSALPVDDEHYALERWQIRFVTSGRDLAAEQNDAANGPTSLTSPCVFADPDYDLNGQGAIAATRAVTRGKEIAIATRGFTRSSSGLAKAPRLPGTAVEADLIAPALEAYARAKPLVYKNEYGLEGVLKLVHSPSVLSLSTHGYYLPDQEPAGQDPAGQLASGQPRPALSSSGGPLENPLLRCGLLLAGCNQRQTNPNYDDGVLTGMEIVSCDLRGTELVVLGACQTGLGDVRDGEGVAGLRQAFQLAGAKAVVSTLWRIPDAATAQLMGDFFKNLAAGQSKTAALANAQLAAIKDRRQTREAAHPYFWAAFTLTGN